MKVIAMLNFFRSSSLVYNCEKIEISSKSSINNLPRVFFGLTSSKLELVAEPQNFQTRPTLSIDSI